MAQYGVPISDFSIASWTQGAGDGDGDAFDELDEGINSGTPDDATTYWQSPGNPSAQKIRCGITALTDPSSSVGHWLRARCKKSSATTGVIDVYVRLYEGATLRAETSLLDIGAVWQTIGYLLSGAQADAISNYSDLLIEVEANTPSTANGRRLHLTAMEFECPDASGGSVTLAGVSAGVATVSGASSLQLALAATATGVATTSGAAAISLALATASTGVATASGALTVTGAEVSLAGVSSGAATVTPSLSLQLILAAVVAGLATASSAVGISRVLAAVVAGVAAASGAIGVTRPLAATASGVATATGATGVQMVLSAAPAGVATAAGTVTVTGSGSSVSLQGSSAGVCTVRVEKPQQKYYRTYYGTASGCPDEQGTALLDYAVATVHGSNPVAGRRNWVSGTQRNYYDVPVIGDGTATNPFRPDTPAGYQGWVVLTAPQAATTCVVQVSGDASWHTTQQVNEAIAYLATEGD